MKAPFKKTCIFEDLYKDIQVKALHEDVDAEELINRAVSQIHFPKYKKDLDKIFQKK